MTCRGASFFATLRSEAEGLNQLVVEPAQCAEILDFSPAKPQHIASILAGSSGRFLRSFDMHMATTMHVDSAIKNKAFLAYNYQPNASGAARPQSGLRQ